MRTSRKYCRRLFRNRGEMYFDTIISVFIIMTVLALAMTLFPLFMKKYKLDMLAEDISRSIAVSGQTNSIDIDKIAGEYGVDLSSCDIVIEPTAVTGLSPDGAGTIIQLAEPFTVTVVTHQTIGLGGVLSEIDIPLTSVSTGRSEVYWKELAQEA